ncbi:MAG: tetratricopeptide repeat protein [Chloroflexota bacterium]
MNILEQFKQLTGQKSPGHPNPETNALRETLDAGQRAKRDEDYPRALETLQAAMNLAHTAQDSTAVAVIALNQADVYIRQKQWSEADQLLQKTYQNAKETNQKTQMAYLLSAMGTLAQAQGDWESAADNYEQALDIARGGHALGAEGRALGFLADTYLHDANASYAAHLFREALPKLNMTGDIELSSFFVGRLGEAMIASGSEVEGDQLLDRAQRLARQMGYQMYERLWSAALGKRAVTQGRFQDASTQYAHFLKLADKTIPSPETADVLCQMSRVCLGLREIPEALDYAWQAVEMSSSLGDKTLITRAKGVLGMALVADKKFADAIPYLQEAAQEYAAQKADVSEIDILRNLAAAQAETNPEDAIATYKQAADRAEKTGARLELAQTRRDLGLLFARQRKMHDAIREWTAALAIYDTERQGAQVARLLCDMGAARKYLGQGPRALKDYEEALMKLNTLNDDWETRGLVLSNAANAYVDQGDMESADSFFNESIAIARRLGNDAAETTRRGNYGWFLLVTGKPQQAISALEYALRMSKSMHLDLQSAIQMDNLGLAYDSLGNYPKALEYHQQALEIAIPLKNMHWEYSFKINQGLTLLAMGQIAEATALLESGLAQGQNDSDIELIIRGQIGLARVALKQNQPESVTTALDEATGMARQADMRRLLAEALSVYSEQQAALKQPERSSSLWDEAQKLYRMLNSPQAKLQPAWLEGKVEIS